MNESNPTDEKAVPIYEIPPEHAASSLEDALKEVEASVPDVYITPPQPAAPPVQEQKHAPADAGK